MAVLLVILIILFFPIPRELVEAVKHLYCLQEEDESIKSIQRFREKEINKRQGIKK